MSFKKAFLFTILIVIYIQFTNVNFDSEVSFLNENTYLNDFLKNSYDSLGLLLIFILNRRRSLKKVASFFEIKSKKKMFSVFFSSLLLVVCVYIFIPAFLNFILFIYRLEFYGEELILPHFATTFFHLLGLLLFAPIFEELFFRRIVAHEFFERYGYKKAIIYSAFLFAIMHIPRFHDLPMIFAFGILAAYLYLKTRNIYITMLLHSLINLYVVLHLKNPMPILRWLNSYYNISLFWLYYSLGILVLISLCCYSIHYINKYHDKYIDC